MANLGLLCQDLQRYDESEKFMRESLAITERILGFVVRVVVFLLLFASNVGLSSDRHADVGGCLRNLAGLFQSRGQYEEVCV